MSGPRGVMINWHFIKDDTNPRFPSLRGPSQSEFRRQLLFLQEAGYEFVRLQDFVRAAHGSATLPPRFAIASFDDGVLDCHRYAWPVLRELGIPAIFFLCPRVWEPRPLPVQLINILMGELGLDVFHDEFYMLLEKLFPTGVARDDPEELGIRGIYRYDRGKKRDFKLDLNYRLPPAARDKALIAVGERHLDLNALCAELYMTPEHVIELHSQGADFGIHTYSHCMLTRLPAETQEQEVLAARDGVIEILPGLHAPPLSYPYGMPGTYDETTFAVLKRHRITVGVAMSRKVLRLPHDNLLEIHRFDCRDIFDGVTVKDQYLWQATKGLTIHVAGRSPNKGAPSAARRCEGTT